MTNIQKLEELLTEEILPEIEEHIDEIFELIASKKATDKDKEELNEVKELQSGFKEMIQEIQSGEIEEDEALEIINDIISMREE